MNVDTLSQAEVLANMLTWLTVSSRAVTGCPLMTIWSSLALPTNFAQGSAWVDSSCPTRVSASFQYYCLPLASQLGNAFSVPDGCLIIPLWNSPLPFKVGKSHFKWPISPHYQHWLALYILAAPCSCWALLTVDWGVDPDCV